MGRHHVSRRGPATRALLAVVAIAAVVATYVQVNRSVRADGADAGCATTPIQLTVGADPSVAPWLSTLAAEYNRGHRAVRDGCATVTVRSVDPATVLHPAGGAPPVDVWAAESSTEVGLARTRLVEPADIRALTAQQTPIATSPVALGLPRDAMQQLQASLGRTPQFPDLLAMARDPRGWGPLATGQSSWGPVRFSTLDPASTTVGASLVVAAVGALLHTPAAEVGAPAFGQVDARNGLLGFVRTLVAAPPNADELLTKVAGATSTADLLRNVGIVAVYERDLWKYNDHNPTVPLQAMYPIGGQLAADHPYVVLDAPWVDPDARAVAADFRGWLLSPAAQDRLGSLGLRRIDGSAGPVLAGGAAGLSGDQVKPEAPVSPEGPAAAQAAWKLITRPVSTLTVLDVSGSMAEKVPGSGRSKLDLAKAAAIGSLGFVEDRDSLGLWQFSYHLVGRRDFSQLVSLGPATGKVGAYPDRRAAAASAYRNLRPRSGTGLYDTVLAAYRTALDRYRPDAVNTVLLVSDGQNEDPGSVDLAGTLARLKAWYKPGRPVHVVTLAYGAKADRTVLHHIAAATGGQAYAAVDPRQISKVLIAAMTSLPGARA